MSFLESEKINSSLALSSKLFLLESSSYSCFLQAQSVLSLAAARSKPFVYLYLRLGKPSKNFCVACKIKTLLTIKLYPHRVYVLRKHNASNLIKISWLLLILPKSRDAALQKRMMRNLTPKRVVNLKKILR